MNSPKNNRWFTPEGLALIEGWRRDGKSREEIASLCGVSQGTFSGWVKGSAALQRALRCDRDTTDYMAELALLKRALGYEYTEETWELKPNKETGESELILTKKQVKHMQPDVSALTFWLKKRRPDIWGDSPDTGEDTSGATGVVYMPRILENDPGNTGGESTFQATT